MPLHVSPRRGLEVAEHAVLVLLLHMGLQEHISCKANILLRTILQRLRLAIHAPELDLPVFPLPVPVQRALGLKVGAAAGHGALELGHAEMVLTLMSVQRVLLPEALPAVLAAEPVGALVHGLVALQTGAGGEGLAAAVALADVFALEGVHGLDVLLQVLVFDVVLVAAVVRALERARVGVGVEVVAEAGGTVERLGAAGPCAGERLEIGGELAPGRRGSCDGGFCVARGAWGLGGGEVIVSVVEVYAGQLRLQESIVQRLRLTWSIGNLN